MNNYEKLMIECEKLGAKVIELDFGTSKPCGNCKGNNIYINRNCNTNEKYCVLNEELGHFLTTYGNILDKKILTNRKQELFARRWGYEHSVSIIGIINAFEYGALTLYDIADFLGVTEEYLIECLEHYKQKYGDSYKIDNYIIEFIPHFSIYKKFA